MPDSYDHPVGKISVVETHISFVILTGRYAYKIKKAVDLGFVSFDTLDKRRHYCNEEMRLNQRFAPQLYIGVVALRGSEDAPRFGGSGPIIEYAVKMNQFDADLQLDRFVRAHALAPAAIDEFATKLAEFHASAARPPADTDYGSIAVQRNAMMDNFSQTCECARRWGYRDVHSRLEQWTDVAFAELQSCLARRCEGGFIRECHGDLHLGNLALIEGKITAFDCLEFNPTLRWVDVVSEVAFLDMDLRQHGLSGLANRFLNRYLQDSGDYPGVVLLTLFRVYRAMVRAKVACLRTGQQDRESLAQDFDSHVALAEQFAARRKQQLLIITHGLSGSGKTTVTDQLLNQFEAIRIRSDIERKRLFPVQRAEVRYSNAATRRTYAHLFELAEPILVAGHSVILDATYLKRAHRDGAAGLATRLGIPLVILDMDAPDEVLRSRISARSSTGHDASEATTEVLAIQRQTQDPLTDAEKQGAIVLHSGAPPDLARLASDLRELAGY